MKNILHFQIWTFCAISMLLDKKKTRVRMATLILQRKSQTSFPPGGNCGSGVPAHMRDIK
jgi:hypothetical protein